MKRVLIVLLVLLMAVSLVACSSDEAAKNESLKVGFVYVGPIGDGGWTFAHDQGRLYLENELGVETIYKETVPEDAQVKSVVSNMIDQGAKVIFATSYGYMDYIEELSKEFPDVTFLHCSGFKAGDNFNNYFGRMYEPRFLSGLVAGLKTETNKLGYVAAFPIPEVIRGINAFTLGAQAVNSDVEVDVTWTLTWYDPAKEKDAGKALVAAGADVIAQHQDTAGPQQAAEEAGAFAIGYNTDSRALAPKAYMTAPIWNWGPYYASQVKAVQEGTWTSTNYWGGLKEGVVALDTLTDVAPAEAKAMIEDYQAKIIAGDFHPFQGPIYNQAGDLVVQEGQVMTDEELLGMMWFVKGVNGKIE